MKTIKYKNGDVYVGNTKGVFSRAREGWGTLNYANGDAYVGNWKNDAQHGEGRLTYANGDVFVGDWRDGKRVKGRLDFKNGDYYEGEFVDDSYGGEGTLFIKNSEIKYVGHFSAGRKHGLGKFVCKEYTYKGIFANDHFHYDGRLDMKSGDWFDGTFNLGNFIRGRCRKTESDGSVYKGNTVGGLYEGDGELSLPDGSVYKGEFMEGKYHGKGKLSGADGSVQSGVFECGELRIPDGDCKPATVKNTQSDSDGGEAVKPKKPTAKRTKKNADEADGAVNLAKTKNSDTQKRADSSADAVAPAKKSGRSTKKNADEADGAVNPAKTVSRSRKKAAVSTGADKGGAEKAVTSGERAPVGANVADVADVIVIGSEGSAVPKPEKPAVKRAKKKTEEVDDAVNPRKNGEKGGKKAGSDSATAVKATDEGGRKIAVNPEDKLYADLEASVKRAVEEALAQYDKALNPKPVIAGLPIVTPREKAEEARRNAEKAQKLAAKFEERYMEEHKYGGALPNDARAYEFYDAGLGEKLIYRGQLNYRNQPHGYGRVEYANGDVYEGELDSARRLGLGRFRSENFTVTGEFSESSFNGVGVMVYDDGDTYMGAFSDGVLKSGVHINPARGLRYEGDFGRGLVRNGYGILYHNDKECGSCFISGHNIGTGYCKTKNAIFRGFYNSERGSGSGVIEFNNGIRYEGQVADYVPHGYGRLIGAQGNTVISGFVKGKPEGIRIVTAKGDKPRRE